MMRKYPNDSKRTTYPNRTKRLIPVDISDEENNLVDQLSKMIYNFAINHSKKGKKPATYDMFCGIEAIKIMSAIDKYLLNQHKKNDKL